MLGAFFIFLSNYFAIFPAQTLRQAFDEVGAFMESGKKDTGNIYSQVFKFAFIIIGFSVLRGLFMFFMRQTIIVMSRRIENDQKNEIFNHYQTLPVSFYKNNSTGDLMSRISEDVSRVRTFVGPAIMYTLNLIFTFVLVIAAMWSVNPRLTLFVLIPLPVLSMVMYFVNDVINKKSEEIQGQLSVLTTVVQEVISGIRVVKAYARQKSFLAWFQKETDSYFDKNISLAKVDSLYFPSNLLLIGLSTLITIYVGGLEVIQGRATAGNIVEFVYFVNMLTWPVSSLGWVTAIIQRAAASQKRINEFLDTKSDLPEGTHEIINLTEGLSFEKVSFTYADKTQPAINQVSFSVPKGTTLGIIGATGSGKSTLANLMVRLMDPQSGKVSIDGKDIRTLSTTSYRKLFGYVPQDVFLFSDTVLNNIVLGAEQITDNELKQAEASSQLAEFYDQIQSLPNGMLTEIGERGISLSGGQKQRLSIARAFYRSPQILLFDDCLSAIDTQTEARILKNIYGFSHGRTAILISHRVSTVSGADSILVLDEGKIIEQGTHQQLITQGGVYARLFDKQTKEARD